MSRARRWVAWALHHSWPTADSSGRCHDSAPLYPWSMGVARPPPPGALRVACGRCRRSRTDARRRAPGDLADAHARRELRPLARSEPRQPRRDAAARARARFLQPPGPGRSAAAGRRKDRGHFGELALSRIRRLDRLFVLEL